MTLDFSRSGLKAAFKEFAFSIFKTVVAAVIAYVGVKLAEYQVPTGSENAAIIIAVIGIVRAALTSFGRWATTLPGEAIIG